MNKVTTVLSDIGNVVAPYDDNRCLEALGTLTGVSPTAIKKIVFGDWTTPFTPFRSFMRGECGADGFRYLVSLNLQLSRELPKMEFEAAFCDIFTLNRLVMDLWRRLRRTGLGITAVSNMDQLRFAQLVQMGLAEVFDHFVLSYQEGLLKPSRQLMLRSLARSGCTAEDAVFIDDQTKNFPPAERLGIRTHQFVDYRSLTQFLQDNGVAC